MEYKGILPNETQKKAGSDIFKLLHGLSVADAEGALEVASDILSLRLYDHKAKTLTSDIIRRE